VCHAKVGNRQVLNTKPNLLVGFFFARDFFPGRRNAKLATVFLLSNLESMHFLSNKIFDWLAPVFGGLMVLSFAPFDVSYLVFLALIFLMASWQVLPPGRAAFRGWLFGLGLFGFGVSWVFVSIHEFGGAGLIGSVLLTAFFVTFWALFPAITGYLSSSVSRMFESSIQVFLMPCLWVLIEYFRGYWFLNGFPWFQIAYTQLESPLTGYIPILGVYGSGFVIALISACCVRIIRDKKDWIGYGVLIGAIWLGGVFLRDIQWTYPIGENIKVSLIQGNITQDQKWAPENKSATLSKYKKMTEMQWNSDIVVWPETAVPAYYRDVKADFLEPLEKEAIEQKTDIIISLPMRSEQSGKNHNVVRVLGQTPGVYQKQHLLPFGEYLPLRPFSEYILNLVNIRLGHFIPGDSDQKLLVAAGYPFITSICYEDAFGSHNIGKLDEAAFLVNVTNDAWFGETIEPYQHMQIARMRALETGRYLLRATNTGVTAVVGPQGKMITQAPLFTSIAINGKIVPMGGMTPYARIGDRLQIYIIGFVLMALASIKIIKPMILSLRGRFGEQIR
ncbi:MAG: apolipoprotein N-acyltransferase, partial [Gammaproteobacteria bacterium]